MALDILLFSTRITHYVKLKCIGQSKTHNYLGSMQAQLVWYLPPVTCKFN